MRALSLMILFVGIFSIQPVYSQSVSLPHRFIPNNPALANEVNDNFVVLRDAANDLAKHAVTADPTNGRVDIVSNGFEVLRLNQPALGARPWSIGIVDNGLAGPTLLAGSISLGLVVPKGTSGALGGAEHLSRFTFQPNGTFTQASDSRLKTNITPLTHVLEKLEQLRGVSFEWKDQAESFPKRAEGNWGNRAGSRGCLSRTGIE
jgi:hypothetical protein